MKRNILGDLLKRLQDANWLEPTKEKTDVKDLVNAAVAAESGLMKDAQVMNLIEFGRSVHAEMAALIDAARRGVAVEGCSLYTTTFPCHDCAKHIVAAGIPRVVYMEPYPKSLAPELYLDSIDVDGVGGSARQVTFQPFVGVAPRRYIDLFTMVDRKDMEGNVLTWNKSAAVPRFQGLPQSYLLHENNALASLYKNMEEKGLRLIT